VSVPLKVPILLLPESAHEIPVNEEDGLVLGGFTTFETPKEKVPVEERGEKMKVNLTWSVLGAVRVHNAPLRLVPAVH